MISGPGQLSVNEVGTKTIATTTLLDARTVMAFASSINEDNTAYFDDTRPDGLNVHPAIAFSLQWKSRFKPDITVNERALPFGVHAYTDLKLFQPFRQGQAITTQGQLIGRRKIAPGVYNIDRYTMTDSSGNVIAQLDYNGITRGATLDAEDYLIADEDHPPIRESSSLTELWRKQIDIPLCAAQQYTECASIYNPIHTEKSVALAAGLPDIILHGSATKAIALTEIINQCFDGDSTRIKRLCGQLRAMVFMNTQIVVLCRSIIDEGNLRTVFYEVINQDNDLAIAKGVVVGDLS